MTCSAIGVPLPTITWQLNGNNVLIDPDCVLNPYNVTSMTVGLNNCTVSQTLNLDNSNIASAVNDPQNISVLSVYNLHELAVVSHLLISSLERDNNGSYTCTVTNMLPETDTISVLSSPTHIVVLGKVHKFIQCNYVFMYILERPDPISVITVEDLDSQWILIQWDIPYDGNSDIVGYNVYIRFVESGSNFMRVMASTNGKKRQANMFTTTTNSYNVTEHIIPFMRYRFAVVACNELGCGDLEIAQPSITVQTQSDSKYSSLLTFKHICHTISNTVPATPQNCSTTAVSSTSVMITWSPPVVANGIITDYSVSYVPGQSLSTADYAADGNNTINIGSSMTNTTLTGLRIATTYSIAIAAYTVVGIGPYSNPVECLVQTLEDGLCVYVCACMCMLVCVRVCACVRACMRACVRTI